MATTQVLITYYSGTGNTKRMAEEIAHGAEGVGVAVKVREIEVSKGLPKRHVKEVIDKAMPVVGNCDKSAIERESVPAGEVVFHLIVGPEGEVREAYMEKRRTEYNDFEKCVINFLKTLQFSAKVGRGEVNVRIVLVLV